MTPTKTNKNDAAANSKNFNRKSYTISHLKPFRIISNELPADPVLMILILSKDV